MLYEMNAYDNNEEMTMHISWKTRKTSIGKVSICDSLKHFMVFGAKKYCIPEGVTTLGWQCFVDSVEDLFDCDAEELELPASLLKIEDDAFFFTGFRSVKIAPGNSSFVIKNGGIYTSDGKRLIYVLLNEERDVFRVEEGTEIVDAGVLNQCDCFKLMVPDSVKRFGDAEVYAEDEIHLIVPKGSYAEQYAKKKGYAYELIEK